MQMIQAMKARIVTNNILILIFGSSGADDGVPAALFPTSCWVFILRGRIIKRNKNQSTEKSTKAAVIVICFPLCSRFHSSCNSIKTPLKSVGCRKITGLP